MTRLSRRQFLARSSLAVAGGVAAATVGPQATGALAATGAADAPTPKVPLAPRTAEKPVVAYVRDGADGELTLMAGHRKIVRNDPDLVRRLLDAAD